MKILNFKFVNYQRGQLLIQILILSAVAVVLMTGIMNWAKVIIESTGRPASSTVERIIRVEMAIPSLAKYATVANDFMRFGQGTEVFGPINVNQGLRFDGLAD